MEIELDKHIVVKEKIEVELPHYFEQDLSDSTESVIYGRIDKSLWTTTIHIREMYGELQFELAIYRTSSNCYFKPEHKSTKESYEYAKGKAAEFFKKL